MCLTRGSKISSYFSQKRPAGAIQQRWNQNIRHSLTTPADAERKGRGKEIADEKIEAQTRKARDAAPPILTPRQAIIFQKGEFLTWTVKSARMSSYAYEKQRNAKSLVIPFSLPLALQFSPPSSLQLSTFRREKRTLTQRRVAFPTLKARTTSRKS